jgi:hypothetical protein
MVSSCLEDERFALPAETCFGRCFGIGGGQAAVSLFDESATTGNAGGVFVPDEFPIVSVGE